MIFFEEKKIQKIRDKIKELLLSDRGICRIDNHKYLNIDLITEDFTTLFIERYGNSCQEFILKYLSDIKENYSSQLRDEKLEDTFDNFYSYCGAGGVLVSYVGVIDGNFGEYDIQIYGFINVSEILKHKTSEDTFDSFDFYLILCELGAEEGLYEIDDYVVNLDKYLYKLIHQ
jgi:hypothetical protein